MYDQITPLIITLDEAANIRRTLKKLTWARRIVVIDSGSTDGTIEILRAHSNVEVIERPFTDFASQCNFGLTQIGTPWVLSIDADYVLSDSLVDELGRLDSAETVAGYRARFVYCVHHRPLRGALYPPRTVLYRRDKACYRNEGHGHRVVIQGDVLALAGVIHHDDCKPLARWFASQQRYAREEARYLAETPPEKLTRGDRVRRMGWPAPIGVFLYTLIAKGCVLDGWAGWYYAMQRLVAEALIAIEVVDRRLRVSRQP